MKARSELDKVQIERHNRKYGGLSRALGATCLFLLGTVVITGSQAPRSWYGWGAPSTSTPPSISGSSIPVPTASATESIAPITPTPTPTQSEHPTIPALTPEEKERGCEVGEPISFTWQAMGLNSIPIEEISLLESNSSLDTPSKFSVGWYAAGPKPGSEQGNVLLNFHMYPDGTGLVGLEFEQRVALHGVGSIITLSMDNGSNCSYKVDNQTTVDKFDEVTGFPALVENENLFRQQGEEGIVVMTCASDEWNDEVGSSQDETVVWGGAEYTTAA